MQRIIVVGASAGGIEALRQLAAGLTADLAAPVCVVLHSAPQSPGVLDTILSRAGPLPAVAAVSGRRLQPGRIYVAPPDRHLLVEPGVVRLTRGPRENRFRPAIDPLFRSAAQVYGPGTIGVILSGNLDDGTAGLWAVKQLGGSTIVQHPDDALFPSMPLSAIANVRVDHIVPVDRIGELLLQLTSDPTGAPAAAPAPAHLDIEVNIAKEQNALDAGLKEIGQPSAFACPECHGVLLELKEGGRTRFRCHTGHAYSISSLLAEVNERIEESLWGAVRALEEGGMLLRTLAEHVKVAHDGEQARELTEQADAAHEHADVVRALVGEREPRRTAAEP
jgi:two-component system chemotaxis response regulator CheB